MMSPTKHDERDDARVDDDLTGIAELLLDLAADEAASAADRPPGLRQALLEAASSQGRLWRFAEAVAGLADISVNRAQELLDSLDDPEAWERGLLPGVESLWVEGGPKAQGAIRGFVRVEEGVAFPEHDHLGPERVLILQGTVEDSRGFIYRPGDIATAEPDDPHSFRPRPDGPDVLIFSVVAEGIRIGPMEIHHRDDPPA